MFRRYKAAANSGVAAALDAVALPIMIADTRYDIAYMNPAMTALLMEAEDDLRRERPGFDVARLTGKNIDLFDIEPSGGRRLVDLLSTARRATIVIGQRVFDLTAKPLPAGGALIEWSDAAERLASLDQAAQLAAIRKSQAVIEFNLDGTVITANENFLRVMGYTLDEIRGKHHGIFVDPAYRDGADYKEFWAKLNRGEYLSAEFKRIAKGGKEVWLQASYNPVSDQNGTPFKVVKFATDVTQEKLRNADYLGQIAAIRKSQAVIEFRLDGTIITANENFLRVMGYSLAEIQGKHHSLFVEPLYRDSDEYKEFWAKLNRGEYQTAEFKRIAKGGSEVYIQATYNPIRDLDGKPFKVVKFAVDVTRQVIARKKAEHVRSMLESVAAGAEQLNASVKEIASSMSKSRDTTRSAVERVDVADHSTRRLAETSQAMGGIVELISNITNQINLLALNATIESARAGDAGKGFAVVANEVKNLANQAKGATEQISKEIAGLRGVSDEVTNALDAIKHSINAVTEYVASTATAVEEQSTVANEMSANMQRAAAEANSLGAAA